MLEIRLLVMAESAPVPAAATATADRLACCATRMAFWLATAGEMRMMLAGGGGGGTASSTTCCFFFCGKIRTSPFVSVWSKATPDSAVIHRESRVAPADDMGIVHVEHMCNAANCSS